MAGDVKVEAQRLITSADVFKTNQSRINGLLQDAHDTVASLSSWEGDAKNNFMVAFNDLSERIQEKSAELTPYINFLNESAEKYSQAEAERAEDNATFEN